MRPLLCLVTVGVILFKSNPLVWMPRSTGASEGVGKVFGV